MFLFQVFSAEILLSMSLGFYVDVLHLRTGHKKARNYEFITFTIL